MKRKKIILTMIEPPLPFGNAAARWYYILLKGLSERNYDVTALATCSNDEDIEKAQKLFPKEQYNFYPFKVSEKRGLSQKIKTLRRPHSYMFSPLFLKKFDEEIKKGCDILHLEQIWSGWLGLKYPQKTILNLHHYHGEDFRGQRATTLRGKFNQKLLVNAENHLIRSLKYFRAFSPELSDTIKKINSRSEVKTIPIGMDISLYKFIEDEERKDSVTVGLFGNLTWTPNVLAAKRLLQKIWPQIKAKVPRARLLIVGWSARQVLNEYLNCEGVTILENVPDMKPYFDQTSTLIYCPEFGSGMKIKILEAMAYGVPVVTNHCGIEGLPAKSGVEVSFAEKNEDLCNESISLLTDLPKQNRQRKAARTLIEKTCSATATLDALETFYEKVIYEASKTS